MPRIIEYSVVEPPTGGEVLDRALGELAAGQFELTLLSQAEVPRPSEEKLDLQLRTMHMTSMGDYSTILAAEAPEHDEYTSITIRVPRDNTKPAEATIVSL